MAEQRLNDEEIYRLVTTASDDEESVTNKSIIISESNYQAANSILINVEEQMNLNVSYDDEISDDNSENVANNRQEINKVLNNSRKERTSRINNKRLRAEGSEYLGEVSSESGYTLVKKPKRVMGERCDSKNCGPFSKFKCRDINEEQRSAIFNQFYTLEANSKIIYVKSLIDNVPIKRRTVFDPYNDPKRECEKAYHLKVNNIRLQVCRCTFLNTLDLKDTTVRRWVKCETPKSTPTRPKKSPNKNIELRKYHLVTYIRELPTVESHYCRKDTGKHYIERPVTTEVDLYR